MLRPLGPSQFQSHIVGSITRENQGAQKDFKLPAFCSVFVWVIPPGLPIETLLRMSAEMLPENRTRRQAMAEIETNADPLCKFGPGGDFVSVWQPQAARICGSLNSLAKPLTSIVQMFAVLLGSKPGGPLVNMETALACNKSTCHHQEKVQDGVRSCKTSNSIDAAATATAADGSLFSREPLLFADHCRVGIRVKHKPKHRIRTYRRATKKRAALWLSEQGSLFETDLASARTA
jgi:hypothetical protein